MVYIVVFHHIVCMRACMCVCMRACVCGVSTSQQPSSGSSSHRVLFTSNQCFPTDLINSKNNQLCMETDLRCDYWLPSSDLHRRRLPRLSSQSNGQHWDHRLIFISLYFWAVGAACMDSKDTYMQMHKVIQPIHGSSLWTCKTCTLGLSCTRPPNNQEKKKRPACWQWQCTFPLLWLRLPEPSIQRFPCQRRHYITAATAPAVHITNAVHCGGDHVLQPGSIQAPAAIAGAQLLQWPVLSVCWESLSHVPFHTAERPCSALLFPLLEHVHAVLLWFGKIYMSRIKKKIRKRNTQSKGPNKTFNVMFLK